MKKMIAAAIAGLLLAGCSSEQVEELKVKNEELSEVTLTFSPYQIEAMTRTAVSIADVVTKIDVWIYESGSEVTAVHQTTADAAFGSVTVTLDKTKTYTLYAIGHKAAGPATIADGIITFPDDKVTHSMFYTTTFSPAPTTFTTSPMPNRSCSITVPTCNPPDTGAADEAGATDEVMLDTFLSTRGCCTGGMICTFGRSRSAKRSPKADAC